MLDMAFLCEIAVEFNSLEARSKEGGKRALDSYLQGVKLARPR